MSNKSEKKPVSAEAKKQLEAIAGTNIEPEQLIGFRFPVGAFDYTSGSTSWRSIIVFPALGLVLQRRQFARRQRPDDHRNQRGGHIPPESIRLPAAGTRLRRTDQHRRDGPLQQPVLRHHHPHVGARSEQSIL